jgi:hypothetical protein
MFTHAGEREMPHNRTIMRLVTAISALLSLSSVASAQALLSDLPAASRVRIKAPGVFEREAVGSITAYGADSLRFTPAKANRQLTLPLDEIASIDRSKGRDHVLGAAVGAVGGAIGGVLLGIACVSVCSDSHSSDANLAPIGGFVIGLPAGTILGALVGIERWQRVRFR